jgi:hypothetical protein
MVSLDHQEFHNEKQKEWHDINLKSNNISVGDLVILYGNKIKGNPIKLETTWLGPYAIK